MLVDIFAGAVLWAVLSWYFVAVLGSPDLGRTRAHSDLRLQRRQTCDDEPSSDLRGRASRSPSAREASFVLHLDGYGLGDQMRRLVPGSATASK